MVRDSLFMGPGHGGAEIVFGCETRETGEIYNQARARVRVARARACCVCVCRVRVPCACRACVPRAE